MKALFFLHKTTFLKSKIVVGIFLSFALIACSVQDNNKETRYVVLSPEIAEIMSYLGVSDKIVGLTAECDYPQEMQNKEKVGNFGQLNLEKIIALNPDLVFTTALEQNEISTQLNKMNIETVQLYPSHIDDLIDMIDTLGVICNVIEKADSLKTYFLTHINEFKKIADARENKPNVFIEIYGDPIMSASNDSYLGQLLLLSGAENIFPSLIRDYARVNSEDVVKLNPDVIILTYPGITAQDVKNRKGWTNINAVKNNKIYTIDEVNPDLLLRAGPRNIQGIQSLIEIFYGENN